MSLPSFLLSPLINLVLPALAAAIVAVVYQWVKKSSEWIDKLPANVHVIAISFLSVVIPLIAKVLPNFTGTDLSAIDQPTLQALVMLALTQITHMLLSPDKAKA